MAIKLRGHEVLSQYISERSRESNTFTGVTRQAFEKGLPDWMREKFTKLPGKSAREIGVGLCMEAYRASEKSMKHYKAALVWGGAAVVPTVAFPALAWVTVPAVTARLIAGTVERVRANGHAEDLETFSQRCRALKNRPVR